MAVTQTIGLARSGVAETEAPVVAPSKARMVDAEFEIRIVRTRADFEMLEEHWNDLFERAGRDTQIFQTFNWMWHWSRIYVPAGAEGSQGDAPLCIITGWDAGRLVMCWPLRLTSTLGVRAVRWMGEPVGQYGDALMEDRPDAPDWLAAAWTVICNDLGADVVALDSVREDAVVAPLLAERGGRLMQEREAFSMDLARADTFAEYEKKFSGRSRSLRRRKRRRLAADADQRFEVLSEGPRAVEAIREALSLKRAWLRNNGLASRAFASQDLDRFMAAVGSDTQRPAGCRVSRLSVGNRAAAVEIGFECKGRHCGHVLAYDPQFEQNSPGALQIEDTLRHCFDQGHRSYDLLAPANDYKKQWADDCVPVRDFAAPTTPVGKLYTSGYLAGLRPLLKAALARLPGRWTRLLTPGAASGAPEDAGRLPERPSWRAVLACRFRHDQRGRAEPR